MRTRTQRTPHLPSITRTAWPWRIAWPWSAASVVAALLLSLVSLLASPGRASAQTAASDIFARVAPSVPVVETPNGHGTGFMFDATHVMTDAHVVEDFETVKVRFPDGATYGSARVVARDRLVDMALIEIAGTRPVTTVIAAPPTVIGSELYVLGYPGRTSTSSQPVFSRGLLSQVASWDNAGMHYIRTDASGEPGTSGGPVLDAAGNVVGVIQFGSSAGAYMIAASAQDLQARAERHLRGEDVDGIAFRVPRGESASSFDVQLRGLLHPEESFFVTRTSTTTARITLGASRLTDTVTVSVLTAGGDWVGGTVLGGTRMSAALSVPLVGGQTYWLSVSSESPARVNIQSSVPLARLTDIDDTRAAPGHNAGLIEHGNDMDCRPIALRVGQKLTARAESVGFDPLVLIASPGGAVISGDSESGEGVRGSDAEAVATSASRGDFTVCVGAAGGFSRAAGYMLTLTASPPTPETAFSGTFATSPARLITARKDNATTALQDGRVLTIDGTDANAELLATAEIFDPVRGTVTAVQARDTIARRDPTPALLNDGRVLVVGGVSETGVTDALSIFNPADGSWVAAGPLAAPRVGAEAVVLDDGRVLIVTGSGAAAPLASAEIFDPATGQLTPAGSMTVARSGLIATKLMDGRVLIAGGLDAARRVNRSAEIYDPATGRFTATGDLVVPRYNHTSTLLPSGLVLIAGGANGTKDLDSAELYDPKTGTFRATGSLQVARQAHSATALPDGRVLVASGAYYVGTGRDTVVEIGAAEVYDPTSGQFTFAGAFQSSRQQWGVGANGMVVFMGGATMVGPADVIESYTPAPVPPPGAAGTFAVAPVFSDSGIALGIFGGGTGMQLEASAKAAGAAGVWVQDAGGAWRLLVVGGPPFLGEAFRAAFPQGLAPSTPVTLTR